MAKEELLLSKVEQQPTIYAYEHIGVAGHEGLIKVGYTTRSVEERVKEQNLTSRTRYRILGQWSAMRHDGTTFTDKNAVHPILRSAHIANPEGEWFRCTLAQVAQAVRSAQMGSSTLLQRTQTFGMRPEQERFVTTTADYFRRFAEDPSNRGLTPHFLWNAKMRFGKTFTTYQLARLMSSPEAMNALMSIEGFRSLNTDIETIINKSEHVKKTKREKAEDLTPKERKELSEEEKEYKSKRKEIQEKLIKFATRIPVFMYLTDYREYCLKDVINQLEPELFRKVTGLTLKDFELLVSLGVFNSELMNDAVYKFKRYEDASLSYTGIDTHKGTAIGLWDTAIDTKVVEESGSVSAAVEDTPLEEKSEEAGGNEGIGVGDRVVHKSFGEGVVMSVDAKYIIVEFADKERKFLYPQSIEKGHLSLYEYATRLLRRRRCWCQCRQGGKAYRDIPWCL